jgi:hypothetical protein
MFSQNGFQTIKEGAAVDIVFDNAPGRVYHARIIAIPKGIGPRADRGVGDARAHQCARRGGGISDGDLDT